MSNAQIIMAKSFGNVAPAMLELRKSVVKELVNGKIFWLTEGNPGPVAPSPSSASTKSTSTTQSLTKIGWPAQFMSKELTQTTPVQFVV